MIVLDTHIWVWWIHGEAHLTSQQWRGCNTMSLRVLG